MKTIIKVALISWLWLLTVNTGNMGTTDTYVRVQMAHAWLTGQDEILPYKPQFRGDPNLGVPGLHNKRYSFYDIGQSLLIMPSNWLGFKLAKWFPELAKKEVLRFWIISFFTFIPLSVAVVVACFWLLRLFNFSEGIAGLTSIVYLLGTSVLSYAQIPQQNNQVLLFVTVGYACVLSYLKHRRFYWIFLCGLSLGFAVLIRATSIIHCLSVGMFLLGCVLYQSYNIRHLFKILLLYLVGLIPFNLVGYFSNYLRLGSFFKSGQVIGRDTVNTDSIYKNIIIKLSSSHLNANQIEQLPRSNQLVMKYMNINFQPFRFRASLIKNQNQNLETLSLLLIGIW